MKVIGKILILLAILAGCASMTPHQRIAAACDASASAMDAITAAKRAGRVSASDHQAALAIYKKTVPFCEPPAASLDPIQKAMLDGALAELLARKEKAR